MKKIIVPMLVLLVCAGTAFAQKKTAPKTKKEKTGYTVGVSMGRNINSTVHELEIDKEFLLQGIRDGLMNSQTSITEKEMEEILADLEKDINAKATEKQKALAEKNKKEGKDFLEENKKKEGVVTLPSGLQYKILKEGNGPKPTADQTVECHYTGTLIDGTEFDSSVKRGVPLEIKVNQVIKGWTEALQLMPVGSKWQLFIPSELGYGERGGGQVIGPNAALIFEVELLSIK
jgi:FKBP-type peptidyl-prolyl cis-trans isomerase FklB